jgi:XTP/dITP diphosphohydrolase
MQQLIFATNNAHKVEEVNHVLATQGDLMHQFQVVPMREIGHTTDLPETHETILENAIEKADFLHATYNCACFSEDSGLEIDALNGEPGVHTAHYSGSRDPLSNIGLVLEKMGDTDQRTARFRTVICLILDGEKHVFEGICEGTITRQMVGTGGFGYDPIFQPDGYAATFAELSPSVKSEISHRARAMKGLIAFLMNN